MLKLLTNTRRYLARRAYQSKLPYQLHALYGEGQTYTPTQITIAIRKAGLCIEHRQIAYEMYLTRDEIKAFHDNSKTHRTTQPLPSIILHESR